MPDTPLGLGDTSRVENSFQPGVPHAVTGLVHGHHFACVGVPPPPRPSPAAPSGAGLKGLNDPRPPQTCSPVPQGTRWSGWALCCTPARSGHSTLCQHRFVRVGGTAHMGHRCFVANRPSAYRSPSCDVHSPRAAHRPLFGSGRSFRNEVCLFFFITDGLRSSGPGQGCP